MHPKCAVALIDKDGKRSLHLKDKRKLPHIRKREDGQSNISKQCQLVFDIYPTSSVNKSEGLLVLVKSPVTITTKNGYTHNKIAEKVAKPSQLSEYRSESSILNHRKSSISDSGKHFKSFRSLIPKKSFETVP